MNNGESLVSAVEWSNTGKGTHRKEAGLGSFLLVLGLVVLAAMAVVLAATPAETPVAAEPSRPALAVGLSGDELAPKSTSENPISGAWNSNEAEWPACSTVDLPALLCNAETLEATP
jgi:hypothetical protein